MRVRRFSLARLRDEEQGAVLAMVAISLIVLIGMAVLTFDLGHGVALKRNMVNAADAGALAAARECGLANGEASAKAAAGVLVGDNNTSAKVTGFKINPSPAVCSGAGNPDPDGHNTVTVTVTVPQEYFFAQIFGFKGGQVVASATAEWTMELSGPAPLKVEALKVDECLAGGTGSHCYVGYQDDSAQYGWLNFPEGWPEKGEPNPPTSCPSSGGANDLKDYVGQMGTGTSGFGPTVWNVPVWVCAKDGKNSSALHAISDWIDTVGNPPPPEPRPVVSFPVVAPASAPCPAEGCWPRYVNPVASYPVIKFQGFYIEKVYETGSDIKKAGLKDECGFDDKVTGNDFCIELTVVDPDDNPTNGNPTVRLIG
jgi:putative Flp pilus-assembly TadE/G-like protein